MGKSQEEVEEEPGMPAIRADVVTALLWASV